MRAWFGALKQLSTGKARIELRIAEVLAWLRRQDPAELGHLTWTGFRRERLDWGASWTRAMIALVESPLPLVRAAAAEGVIPLRTAVRAVGIAPETQESWLESAFLPPDRAEPRLLDEFTGTEADEIRRARRLARICLGRGATNRQVDEHLVRVWRERWSAEQILEAAREKPGVPEPPPPLAWADVPTDVASALAELEVLQFALRGRSAVLAKAWVLITYEGLWTVLFEDMEQAARELLGVGWRQAQRLTRLGWSLDWYPALEAAVRAGLSPRDADRIGRLGYVQDWIEIAARVGRTELACALSDAEADDSRPVLAAYREAIALADQATTSAGAPPARVAIPHPPDTCRRGAVRAEPQVLPAARWWNETVQLPKQRGFQQVKEAGDFRCANPECGRQSLRVEAHHVVFRTDGGPDETWNGVPLCPVCHLRGVHGSRLKVAHGEVGGRAVLWWTWPDGRTVMQLRDAALRPTRAP